jgi:glucosyl-dolichyl phosphate glucuronosyltransferase
MDLSVVICTHDRYDALRDSVARLVDSSGFRDPRCELVVVENTPRTKRRDIPLPARADVRLTICETQGLSHARNHGIDAARCDVIAFLDDDALVSDSWCTAILDRMASDNELLVMGGRVDPLYAGDELPGWYDERLASYLSCIDWGMTPRFLREGEWVVGANIVFRRSVFETYGTFDANLGRRGAASLLSNEESALLARLGIHRVFYDPAAHVQHVIPVERLTTRWFRRRVCWQAISDLVAGSVRDDDPSLWREYREIVSQLEPSHRNLTALTFDPDNRETFQLQLRAVYLATVVLGYGGVAP